MSGAGASRAPGLSREQKLDWLRLLRSENVGPVTFRALINRYGGAGEALAALPGLSSRGGLNRPIRLAPHEEAERELAAAEALGAELVAWGDEGYPPIFAHVEAAPPLLYILGRADLLRLPMIAIVGARNASAGGRRIAAEIAAGVGQRGHVVVSGLARGVDGAAHAASLRTGTVAVLAGGIGHIYPPEHADLARQIAEQGTLLTEMPPNWVPRAQDFPRRNRIIAGLALATVVVEAARRSGSLITARLAGEMGREILAVPGSPLDPRCEGTNMLIRQGATLARSAEDVLEAVSPLVGEVRAAPRVLEEDEPSAAPADPGDRERADVLEALSPTPTEVDEIIRQTGLAPAAVQMCLVELELAGRLERHAGQRVSLT
ncbi:DNA-processing protein DprA [Lutibaculum baratangense]|uniref:Rossmann fold nucleotide-binding protein Smf possibly involved in DNA uptake n=1 Tax=Lutibaculum baratangense AMV1 TaxID=631454 RepID=V4RK15_9HYPH|nr:DNA-processing protein DprA [Lutibaculum baratangense]ESR23600.1 Rossmann fold nucleotide-binding protein Smf possibly involved in DNA uptake [Lutibaculum baratangense AMV1]